MEIQDRHLGEAQRPWPRHSSAKAHTVVEDRAATIDDTSDVGDGPEWPTEITHLSGPTPPYQHTVVLALDEPAEGWFDETRVRLGIEHLLAAFEQGLSLVQSANQGSADNRARAANVRGRSARADHTAPHLDGTRTRLFAPLRSYHGGASAAGHSTA
jgi:hypothetical protein